MTVPVEPIAVPSRVADLAGTAAVVPVWRNLLGGVTFRTDDGRFIKYGPRHDESTMASEAERMAWAAAYVVVPRVLEVGSDETHEWLVTAAAPGESAIAPRWLADPATAAWAVGSGLRQLHDALPVADCPFDWSIAHRVEAARARGVVPPGHLAEPPPVDRLVVCQGDACCPNTLVDDEGRPSAHVDLGSLGVADRWADIAPAAASAVRNYGPGWDLVLIRAYGLEPDHERLAFYAAAWEAL